MSLILSGVSPRFFFFFFFFRETKAFSQICEMLVSRVYYVLDCERGFAKFRIVPDLRMFVLRICCVELWARLTICMTKAWLLFASLFLESIVTSAAGEISDPVVGINYPAEGNI